MLGIGLLISNHVLDGAPDLHSCFFLVGGSSVVDCGSLKQLIQRF